MPEIGAIGSGTIGSGTIGSPGEEFAVRFKRVPKNPSTDPAPLLSFGANQDGALFEVKLNEEPWESVPSLLVLDESRLLDVNILQLRGLSTTGHTSESISYEWAYRGSRRYIDMMKRYPPFLRTDPTLQAINWTAARELDRIETSMDVLMTNFTPQNADLFLNFWEALFELPVNPVGKTADQRRQTIVAFLRRLSGGQGSSWTERVQDLLGSGWRVAVHTPQGIRGLIWDRFFGIEEDWEFAVGDESYIGIYDPSGWIPVRSGTVDVQRKSLGPAASNESMVQFTPGGASGKLKLVVKRIDAEDWAEVSWTGGNIEVGTVDEGVYTRWAYKAAALTPGDMYWLVGRVVGNQLVCEVWDSDPTKNNGKTYLFQKEVTLTGAAATRFGTGVVGTQALRWTDLNDEWLIRQVRINQFGLSIPANTLRVTIPYEEDSYRAVEVMRLLRSITPANTAIEVFFDTGFILGKSLLGVQGL